MLFLDFPRNVIHELTKIENLLEHRIHCYSERIDPEDFYNKCESLVSVLALDKELINNQDRYKRLVSVIVFVFFLPADKTYCSNSRLPSKVKLAVRLQQQCFTHFR